MMKNRIRNWLIAPFIGLFLLPLFVMGVFLSLQNYNLEKEKVIQQQQEITAIASRHISSFLHEQNKIITSMLHTNYLPGLTLEQKRDVLKV